MTCVAPRISTPLAGLAACLLSIALPSRAALAQPGWAADPPDLAAIVAHTQTESELRLVVERYEHDRDAVRRRYPVAYSPDRLARLDQLQSGWIERLAELDFEALSHEGQIDHILLRNRITFDNEMLALDRRRWPEIAPLVPFAEALRALVEARLDRVRADPRAVAETMHAADVEVRRLLADLPDAPPAGMTAAVAARAADYVDHLREVLEDFNTFYAGYDPLYTWWVAQPYGRLGEALDDYAEAIRGKLVGIQPGTAPIVGDPVLAEGLQAYLAVEMIPYTAEELIAIGEKQFARTVAEFREVARAMGFGDDWQAAVEHVKTLAPPPGEKPWVIFEIGDYSEDFVAEMDAITVPPLAAEVWRLAMQTPQRQLVNPFFTGGEVTRVSYPTNDMAHEDKMMSMRGNTPSFNFATVHHELIPGHHLQSFMSRRFNSHREGTPFWGEGWALYWELLLWENDFPRSNEDRIGMLFWRLHRAARIIFSLNFQLGNWTPQECVNFLIEEVGHERANAEAEVRRSVRVNPLYQIAYLIGGLQFRALHRELVESGRMTARAYHDAVLMGGRMPVEMVRARLTDESLTADREAEWRFYDR